MVPAALDRRILPGPHWAVSARQTIACNEQPRRSLSQPPLGRLRATPVSQVVFTQSPIWG